MSELPATIEDAKAFYRALHGNAKTAAQWHESQRWLGRHDLFYLLTVILRRPDMDHPWQFDRARMIQQEPDGCIDLWAREHGKSSWITFALTIMDILNNPEITVGIFSHTRRIAKGFLLQIMREFEMNEELKALYPEVLYANPAKESPQWAIDDGICVKRKGNPKEPTIEASGLIDSQPTSRHYMLRVYDDVVTRESVATGEQITKTTEAWSLSQNLGMQEERGGRVRYIGTRYCLTSDARILMADWSHKAIADVQVGDMVIGWNTTEPYGKRFLQPTKVVHCGIHEDQPVRRYGFSNGRSVTCTADHRWWRGSRGSGDEYKALGLDYHKMSHIHQLLIPTEQNDGRDAAWLAGFYDGEGGLKKNKHHPSGCLQITQSEKNQVLIDRAEFILDHMGFDWTFQWSKLGRNPCKVIYVGGGWRDRYRFLVEIAPTRRKAIEASLLGHLRTEQLALVSDDDVGFADVHWIQTETENYVAEGFCSKNSLYDSYSEIIKRGAAKPRIFPATHNGRFDGEPVYFSQVEWEKRVRDQLRSTVAAQLLQNPLADQSATFRVSWLKSWDVRPRTMNCYIMMDPSRGKNSDSDNTAISVIGVASGGTKFFMDGCCHRMALSERWLRLRNLYKKWSRMDGIQHIEVGVEAYGMQTDTEYFDERMMQEKLYFPITELNWSRDSGQSKQDRVARLEPDFRNGRIFLPSTVWMEGSDHYWRVGTDRDPDAIPKLDEIAFRPSRGMTAKQMDYMKSGSSDLVAAPLLCKDSEGKAYDLTLALIDEYQSFPFGRLKDLIDACSRIYDLSPSGPMTTSLDAEEERTFFDA
jgi:hypothetical protein